MLIIWTSADTTLIRKVMGPIVSRYSVPHKIVTDVSKLPVLSGSDVLLACGGKALDTLKSHGLVPKGRTISSMRDRAIPASQGTLFVTFDATIVQKDYARLPEIQWDTQLAIRMHNTRSTKPQIGKYRYVDSLHELIASIDLEFDRTGNPVVVTADLETLGLDEYNPNAWIIACSFTVKKGTADVLYFSKGECPIPPKDFDAAIESQPYWEGLWIQLNWIFTSRKVSLRGANFKYDSRWIYRKWHIEVTNLKMDTMLVGALLDENRSNSLKLHAKIYTPMGGYEDDMKTNYDMARIDLVPKQKLLPYSGGDSDATYQVSEVLRTELVKDRKLADFYAKILHPSSKVFEKMERTGVCLDVPYYLKLQTELEVEIKRLDKLMKGMIPRKLAIKYQDNFSLTRPALMREFLFTKAGLNLKPTQMTAKGGEPSTAMDHLMTFGDIPEAKQFIDLLKESNSASKTLSTFVTGFLTHLRSDGRFHANYRLARGSFGGTKDEGAVTGRTSCTEPALQTIPKRTKWTKKLRRALIPPPGKTILQLDYSQGELKITACLAEEPVMIAAYLNGADLHAITAAQLSGYTYTDFMLLPDDIRDDLRSGGKAGNFGLIYGMGALGFQDYAYSTYGVWMEEQEAIQKRTAFFELYKRLQPWHTEYKSRAKRLGYVRSPLGRIRHLPLITSKDREAQAQAERQAINSPVQSCLSDMMQLAMIYIAQEYGDQIDMFLMTHDSIAAYVPIGDEVIWAKRLKAIMDNLPLKQLFGWDHQLQFTTDAECCTPDSEGVLSLAYLKKLKGL